MSPATILRTARQAAGLTQAQLARHMRTTQSAVARLEHSGSNPRIQTIEEALRATGHRLELRAVAATPPVDETQIAARLRLTPAERLAAFTASHRNLSRLAARARRVEKPA